MRFSCFIIETSELEEYRQEALRVLTRFHSYLHRLAEEILVDCQVHAVKPVGSVTDSRKFREDSDVDIAIYVDCQDRSRTPGLQEDLSEELQAVLAKHPLPHVGVVNCLVFYEPPNRG